MKYIGKTLLMSGIAILLILAFGLYIVHPIFNYDLLEKNCLYWIVSSIGIVLIIVGIVLFIINQYVCEKNSEKSSDEKSERMLKILGARYAVLNNEKNVKIHKFKVKDEKDGIEIEKVE